MTYAALGALLSVVLALPVGLLVVRHASVTSTLVERSTYTANALPGIVVALALITVTINYAVGLYQSAVVLMAAYLILFLSRAVVSVRASLEQAPPVLENVAKSLGLSGLATTWRVTVPIVLPRSEEHTSELQSLMRISYAVFCLKKKPRHLDTKLPILYQCTP